MRKGIFIALALIMSSGMAAAQMHGGQDGQHMMGRGHMTSDQQ